MTWQPVGLDLSLTSTGIATTHGETTIKTKLKGMSRLAYIAEQVETTVEHFKQPLIVIEGYAYGAQGRAVYNIGELGGVVRHNLWSAGHLYIDVPPTKLKKFVTGKGNANKAAVVSAVTHRAGREFGTDDEADAFGLYAMGCCLLGLECPLGVLPKAHLGVLDDVVLPEGIKP